MERPARKPCAASCTGTFSSTFFSTQCCAAFSLGSGAEMMRMPPVFFGSAKRT